MLLTVDKYAVAVGGFLALSGAFGSQDASLTARLAYWIPMMLLGSVWGGWLHVTFLWIDEAVRGQHWATRLMDQAEDYARERGCHSATLDTHSFQARPFYERRGYEVFGILDDYPKGHKKFFLKKKL